MDPKRLWNNGERLVPEWQGLNDLDVVTHRKRYVWVAERLGLVATTIVDWGCGVGYGGPILRQYAKHQYTGVELNPEVVEYAKATYGAACQYQVGAIESCLMTADVGIAFEVLEHLDTDPADTVRLLKARHRLLAFSVPLLEDAGLNPHHRHSGLRPESFGDLPGVRWFQQPLTGGPVPYGTLPRGLYQCLLGWWA